MKTVERGNLAVRGLSVGSMPTNCYLAWNVLTGDGILIDPADEAEWIASVVEGEDFEVRAILLTHGHYDHIYAVEEIRDLYGSKVYAHWKEQEVLRDGLLNHSRLRGRPAEITADVLWEDGEELEFGPLRLRALHTPGHTQGGGCYYFYEEGILFSGDTLFRGAVGRDDLPTGDGAQLRKSVREKLFALPDDTLVLPGHGMPTTIGEEKAGMAW